MRAREDFALYLAEKLARLSIKRDLPIGIYGYAFKRNVAITDGSHALLVSHLLKKRFSMDCYLYDPMIDEKPIEQQARVFLVGANHDEARIQKWPPGSVVVDPWHIIDAPEVEVIRIG
jgi:UDP-N-acetyl-D-mannosaminuronate dehydrogenase